MLFRDIISDFIKYLTSIDRSKQTINGYRKELNYFNNYMTEKNNTLVYLEDITLEDLEAYILYLKQKGNKSASRSRVVYILRSFYNYAVRRDLCTKNLAVLIEPVKVKQEKPDYLTEKEFKELRDEIQQPIVRTAVETMFYSGMRISEVTNLSKHDVHLDEESKYIQVVGGKGNKDRTIPISIKLEKILKHYLKEIRPKIESDNFFCTEISGALSNSYINSEIRLALEKLPWGSDKKISAHNLRHSFASNIMMDKNASLSSVKTLLGHEDLRVTSRYIHEDMEQLQDSVNLL